jgi:hypothetical protein
VAALPHRVAVFLIVPMCVFSRPNGQAQVSR